MMESSATLQTQLLWIFAQLENIFMNMLANLPRVLTKMGMMNIVLIL